MHIHLAATPDHLDTCLTLTQQLAHVAFRVDRDGTLLCRALPPALRGGLMVVDCEEAFPAQQAESLSREVLRVCVRRSFSGIVLDLPEHPCASVQPLVQYLNALCIRHGRRLYVPPNCAEDAPQAHVLICTALSGGTLAQYLQDACTQYGTSRIALDLQRLMMEFPLPCPSGMGTPLKLQQLAQRRQGRSIYYCDALCARYFTRRQGGETHFVLFDDADTLQRKMALAEGLGITEGFFMWPEVRDIAAALFEKKKEGEP